MALAQASEAIAPLEADALIADAQAQTGFTDFGPDLSFMTGFREIGRAHV